MTDVLERNVYAARFFKGVDVVDWHACSRKFLPSNMSIRCMLVRQVIVSKPCQETTSSAVGAITKTFLCVVFLLRPFKIFIFANDIYFIHSRSQAECWKICIVDL